MEQPLQGKECLEEKLRKVYYTQRLMEEVIAFRNEGHLLRKIVKQTCNAEASNLQNVEISIPNEELKLPNANEWPKCPKVAEPFFDLETVLEDCDCIAQSVELLK